MDKNRDTEEIEFFCAKFEDFSKAIWESASVLKSVVCEVEEALPDDLGTLATGRVREFADKIMQLAEQGQEPIRKLRRVNLEIEDEVKRMIRSLRQK